MIRLVALSCQPGFEAPPTLEKYTSSVMQALPLPALGDQPTQPLMQAQPPMQAPPPMQAQPPVSMMSQALEQPATLMDPVEVPSSMTPEPAVTVQAIGVSSMNAEGGDFDNLDDFDDFPPLLFLLSLPGLGGKRWSGRDMSATIFWIRNLPENKKGW